MCACVCKSYLNNSLSLNIVKYQWNLSNKKNKIHFSINHYFKRGIFHINKRNYQYSNKTLIRLTDEINNKK